MSTWNFFKIRLVRLHPLVVLGTLIGLVGFWVDPFATAAMQHNSGLKMLLAVLLSCLALPAPDIRGWGETHPLDGPCWSLLQEYLANVLYALVGRRLGRGALGALVAASAVALVAAANWHGDVATGWSYETFWFAVVRMMYPFFAGLLLFRLGWRVRIRWAFPVCSLVLAVLFCLPTFRYNGWYEAACIILAFPLVVAAGAGSAMGAAGARVSRFLGELSYPLYITHYPLIYIYTAWVAVKKPGFGQALPVAVALLAAALLLAYAALKLYDEPVRRWLTQKLLRRPAAAASH